MYNSNKRDPSLLPEARRNRQAIASRVCSYSQPLKILGYPLCQIHRFRIQFINLGVYRAHGSLKIEVLIHLFRRYTHIAARSEAPVVLFDFIDADQLNLNGVTF